MRRNRVISKRKLISNIVGWPDYYISKRSRLYRYYPKRKVWMLLKGTLNQGRIYHILRDSNKHKRIQASRLVALAWVPNPESKPHVCHKDNNPQNNIHTNLYWGTQKENIQQCIRDNRFRPQGKVPISRKGILNLNKDYLNGVTIKELKQKYNITHIHRYVKETKKRYRLGHDRVRELIRDKAKGYSNKELGEKYKLSKASISHYLNRSL